MAPRVETSDDVLPRLRVQDDPCSPQVSGSSPNKFDAEKLNANVIDIDEYADLVDSDQWLMWAGAASRDSSCDSVIDIDTSWDLSQLPPRSCVRPTRFSASVTAAEPGQNAFDNLSPISRALSDNSKATEPGRGSFDTMRSRTLSSWSLVSVTSRDSRRVHFPDERSRGPWEDSFFYQADETCEVEDSFLRKHAPDERLEDYTSSLSDVVFIPHRCDNTVADSDADTTLMDEIASIEFSKLYEQRKMAVEGKENMQEYRHEERQLDKALILAGVHVKNIHTSPDEVQQSSVISLC